MSATQRSNDYVERLAILETKVEQMDTKLNWLLGLVSGSGLAMLGTLLKLLLAKG
jgi:hypothetical protein